MYTSTMYTSIAAWTKRHCAETIIIIVLVLQIFENSTCRLHVRTMDRVTVHCTHTHTIQLLLFAFEPGETSLVVRVCHT